MVGSVLAVLAAYQNYLMLSENGDVTSGSMSPDSNVGKIPLRLRKSYIVKIHMDASVCPHAGATYNPAVVSNPENLAIHFAVLSKIMPAVQW